MKFQQIFTLLCSIGLMFLFFCGITGCWEKPSSIKNEVKLLVKISTSLGDIVVELDQEKAPITTANFLKYVDEGYYDSLVFHRVIPSFMIQGGGMTQDLKEKSSKYPPIKNEAGNGLTNKTGTIAMARTQIVDSATSQFFINTADNAFLNHKDETPQGFGYAVFGRVVSGIDVVQKIEHVATTSRNMHENVPVDPVLIKSVSRILIESKEEK